MCRDVMATDGRKQRDSRPRWWRRRRSGYAAVSKATVRKHLGSLRWKPERRSRSPANVNQGRANAFSLGAKAPLNTTQYLMELVYSDLDIVAPPSRHNASTLIGHKHAYSYTEDTMDFQHRDFESVFFRNEI